MSALRDLLLGYVQSTPPGETTSFREIYLAVDKPRPHPDYVRHVLDGLVSEGLAVKPDRGRYAPPGGCPDDPEESGHHPDIRPSRGVSSRARRRDGVRTCFSPGERGSEAKALASLPLGKRPRARDPRSSAETRVRRPRWGHDHAGGAELLAAVREILEPELQAGDTIERKLGDATRFPRDRVATAVAHCWLLRARGRPIKSFAASFWWALSTAAPGELEEGSVANLAEARALAERAQNERAIASLQGPSPEVVARARAEREAREAALLERLRAEDRQRFAELERGRLA